MSSALTCADQRNVWPVVVVGTGPAGLVAASTLARAGSRFWCSTAGTAVFSHPRATVVSLRSMELFRSWGLEEEIRAGGDEVEWRMLAASTLSDAASGSVIEVGYPTTNESAGLSPTRPAAAPQDHLETVLLDELRRLPAACVEIGVTVEDVWEATSGLQLRVAHCRPWGEPGREGPVRDWRGRRAQCGEATARRRYAIHERRVAILVDRGSRAAVGRSRPPSLRNLCNRRSCSRHVSARRAGGPLGLRLQLGSSVGARGRSHRS